MNIEVMKTMLEHQYIEIDQAISGSIALNLIKERIRLVQEENAPMYKIILLDYSMPEMDGP